MNKFERKNHWEQIYRTKPLTESSWFEPVPETSLRFLEQLHIPLNARIIDVGGGDSMLVDYLIDSGYEDITVLDISEAALERARQRLGERAAQVKWIEADAATFKPTQKYDFWHDRAAFHFLTAEDEIRHYIHTVQQNLNPGGILLIGTFSETGPAKCSGLNVKQYSEGSMTRLFAHYFDKIECIQVDHHTPAGALQNFIFCSFRKIK